MVQSVKKYKDFEIDIMGQIWSVRFAEQVIDPATGQLAAGRCDMDITTIWIALGQDHDVTRVTFFHELFHAYVRRSGIYNGQLSFDMEEIISDQFGTVLNEIMDFDL